MTTRLSASTLGPLLRLAAASTGAEPTDGDLLARFVAARDEGAFAALAGRHGPMVLGVCRRVLPNEPDAEDAFQATFLILALKAASVTPAEMVGNWLYGVARTTALKAGRANRRRAGHEHPVAVLPEPASVPRDDHWDDLLPILDAELSHLPDRYRAVLVLCDLEGVTRREAARRLSLPEGTVNSRLARARAILAKRLTRHGVALSIVALVATLTRNATACVPASVASSTVRVAFLTATGDAAAMGAISANVAALTHGMGQAMLATKFKLVTAVILMIGTLGLTYSLAVGGTGSNGPDPKPGRVVGDDEKVVVPPAPDAGGGGIKTDALPDGDWHPLTKNKFVAVHVERCLYEVKGEKRFLMAVRLTNLTDVEIGVDLRGKQPGVYPNQWGVQDTQQREIIDEGRAVLTAPDQDQLRADFKAARLTALPAGKSTITYTEFNSSGRADVDRCKGKYLIVSMAGQVVATDGKTVETASCAWTDGIGAAETDVVLPFPVTWKVAGGAVRAPDQPLKVASDDKPRTIHGVVKEVDGDSILLVGGERAILNERTKYLRETGLDAATANRADVTKGMRVYMETEKGPGGQLIATLVVIELLQPPKPKEVEGDKGKPADDPKPAGDSDAVMKAMDGFRKKLPEPQGLNEQNGLGVVDIDGKIHPDSHLAGIASRLGVKTRAKCIVLLTYLKDPDPKIRRIAAFAIESVVKAYPTGMSSGDIQKVDSDGHRKMVKAFIAGIEKLPK
jgi:RNA polymerase sigma factor (sigma-70 family)